MQDRGLHLPVRHVFLGRKYNRIGRINITKFVPEIIHDCVMISTFVPSAVAKECAIVKFGANN